MPKVAVFVEGHTELALTVRLLQSLCGKRDLAIEVHQQDGGSLHFRRLIGSAGAELVAMVANCSADGQVKTQIADRYAKLVSDGFSRIIGVRDVYPIARADIPRLEANASFGLPTGPVPIEIHLAVMEVEAWFLDEISHFPRIHPALTVPRLLADGFNIEHSPGESWDHPADTLDLIYKLEGLAWKKKAHQIERTVDAICMDAFYVDARARAPSLSAYIASLEAALFPF